MPAILQVAPPSPRGSRRLPARSRSSPVTCTNGLSTASAVPRRPCPFRPVPRGLASGGGKSEGKSRLSSTRVPHLLPPRVQSYGLVGSRSVGNGVPQGVAVVVDSSRPSSTARNPSPNRNGRIWLQALLRSRVVPDGWLGLDQPFNKNYSQVAATSSPGSNGITYVGVVQAATGVFTQLSKQPSGYGTLPSRTAGPFNPRTGRLWYAKDGGFGSIDPKAGPSSERTERPSGGVLNNSETGAVNDHFSFGPDDYGPSTTLRVLPSATRCISRTG